MGRLASPFIDEGEDAGHIREKERDRERDKERKAFGIATSSISFYTGPTDPIDDDEDGSMSRPCLSLAPYAGVVS